VYQAKALLKTGDAGLVEAVKEGRLSLYAALKKAREKTDAGPGADAPA
jgi:DNA-binding transcriptional ArsR family regulator